MQRNSAVTVPQLQAFGNEQVIAHGFDPAGPTVLVMNHPPVNGAFAGNAGYVEAIVSEPTNTFFGRILGLTTMTPGARAVAGTANPVNCLITTGLPGTTPYPLELGRTTITLNGCGAAIGGDAHGSNPTASITGTPPPAVGVVDTCDPSTMCGPGYVPSAPAPTDPLANLPDPPAPDPATCITNSGNTETLTARCYTRLNVGGNQTVTLNPGVYYVTDGVYYMANHATITGTGVMIYLAGPGGMDMNVNNSTLHLVAPTSGPYTGVAIFQSRTVTTDFSLRNSFDLDVFGAIYVPSATIDIQNGFDTSSTCQLFVAESLKVRNGNGTFSNFGCAGLFPGAAYLSVSIAE